MARAASTRTALGRASGWLLAAGLAVVIVSAVVRAGAPGPTVRFEPATLATRLGVLEVREIEDGPFPFYLSPGAQGDPLVAVASRAVTSEIEGYGGPLNLLVVVDWDGAIVDVQLLESEETPAYLVGVDGWLGGLRGLTLDAPIDPGRGEPVDTLTGATVTTTAALQTVDAVRREVATEVLRLEVPHQPHSPSPWTRLPVLALAGLFAAAIPVLISGDRRVRFALMLLSVAVAGVWFNQQLSAELLAVPARLDWPGGGHPEGWILLAGALGLGLAFGPAYCGVLCPFGAVQEWLGRLGLARRPGRQVDRAGRALKYGLLLAALAGFLISGSHGVLAFDPLQTHMGWRAGGALLALVLLSAAGAALFPRFWCRYLCVVGAALALTNRLALLRRFLPRRRYDRCEYGVASAGDGDCLQCNRCRWLPAPEHLDAAERAVRRERQRATDRLLIALLAAALVLVGVTIGGAVQRPPLDGLGETHPVDVDRVRERIEQRELSAHPAEHWEPVD